MELVLDNNPLQDIYKNIIVMSEYNPTTVVREL